VEFEKEFNNAQSFTVPTRSIARIVGKGGASIKEIKETTDTQVDIDRGTENSGTVHITVRGTKAAAAAAKAAIMAIANQVGEEASTSVLVESRFHRTLIGAGGQGLRDLVSRCGGPSDSKALAGLIRL
jgi:polyribonucleotide nucleotidyltransferase